MKNIRKLGFFYAKSLFLFVFMIPASSWAWNSMCHSPVQMAAFMSSPNTGSGKAGVRKQIRALKKRIKAYEGKLDSAEASLAESLSEQKLNDQPYSVASEIGNYMASGQNGWACAEGRVNAFLHPSFSLFDLIFPSAYATKKIIDGTGSTDGHSGDGSTSDCPHHGYTPEKDNNGELQACKCETPKKEYNIGGEYRCLTCTEHDPGSIYEPDQQGCVCKNDYKPGDDGKCRELRVCENGEGLENNNCVKCSAKPGAWIFESGTKPCKCSSGVVGRAGKCFTESEACRSRNGQWSDQNSFCCEAPKLLVDGVQCIEKEQNCKNGEGLENNNCVKCSDKPGLWTFISITEPCKCPTGAVTRGGKCLDEREVCESEVGYWRLPYPNNPGECVKKEDCDRKDRIFSRDSGCGECKAGFGLENNNCVKCSDKPGGAWDFIDGTKPCKCKHPNKASGPNNEICITADDDCAMKKPNSVWDINKCVCKTGFGIVRTREARNITESCVNCQEHFGAGWILEGRVCVCKGEGFKRRDRECIDLKAECESTLNFKWTGSSCVCKDGFERASADSCVPKETPEESCNGHQEDDGTCITQESCDEQNRSFSLAEGCGDCKTDFTENDSGRCVEDSSGTSEEDCYAQDQVVGDGGGCEDCPERTVFENGACVPQQSSAGVASAGEDGDETTEEQEDEDCPDWKKDSAFKSGGQVRGSFCDGYASNNRECKRALKNMQKYLDRLASAQNKMDKLKDKLSDLEDSDDESKTEATGVCFDCLKRVLKASRPSAGQTAGNVLKMLTGAGLGLAGYRVGQRAQDSANMLRIQQGNPVNQDYFALNGMSVGYPFVASGIHGLTRANTPVGGWACTPSISYPSFGYNQGYMMGYY